MLNATNSSRVTFPVHCGTLTLWKWSHVGKYFQHNFFENILGPCLSQNNPPLRLCEDFRKLPWSVFFICIQYVTVIERLEISTAWKWWLDVLTGSELTLPYGFPTDWTPKGSTMNLLPFQGFFSHKQQSIVPDLRAPWYPVISTFVFIHSVMCCSSWCFGIRSLPEIHWRPKWRKCYGICDWIFIAIAEMKGPVSDAAVIEGD